MKFILIALTFLVSLGVSFQAHATLSIFLKDPISKDYGTVMISSTSINDEYLSFLMPGRKNVGIAAWGGNPDSFSLSVAYDTFDMMASRYNSNSILKYVLDQLGVAYYRYSFMSRDGSILGVLAPTCVPSNSGCGSFVDNERGIVIIAGGQEPGVITKTFQRLQALQDFRKQNYLNGWAVEPFSCYLINSLKLPLEYGAETRPITGGGVTIDLSAANELLRASAVSAEANIITELKKNMRIKNRISCLNN